jgi:hypothetical protein
MQLEHVLTIPTNWVSGVYLAKLTASTSLHGYLQFVVREDARASACCFNAVSRPMKMKLTQLAGAPARGSSLVRKLLNTARNFCSDEEMPRSSALPDCSPSVVVASLIYRKVD